MKTIFEQYLNIKKSGLHQNMPSKKVVGTSTGARKEPNIMIRLNPTPILLFIACALFLGSLGCAPGDRDGEPSSFERAIAAIDDDTPCNEVGLLVEEAEELGESARQAVEVDAALCSNCVCDLDDLHQKCEDLPTCAKNSKAHAIKGNTCSAKRCDAESPCGGRIVCKKGGVVCGELGSDLGTCEWQ